MSGQLHAPATLPWDRLPPPPLGIGLKAGRASETCLDDMEIRNFLAVPGLDIRPLGVVQLVASRYTDWDVSDLVAIWHSLTL
jgi:hypothetical protein